MGRINIGRVILGGIVAGIVVNILGYLLDGLLLVDQWNAGMKALGKGELSVSQIVGFNIIGLAYGIFVVWLYAAIRPRYGPGPKAAVFAGLMAWVIGTLLPNVAFMGVNGLFPQNLTIATTAGALVGSLAGALAGAAVYKEEGGGTAQSIAARA
jgi:hypothetical protein